MKKTSIIITIASLLFVGCSVSGINNDIVESPSDRLVFTAGFENPDTKVYVDEQLKTHWNEGDEISIFTTTVNQQFRFEGNTGDIVGDFSEVRPSSSSGSAIPSVYSVYPYSSETSISTDGEITLYLPHHQDYVENSYGPWSNTMVAVAESSSPRSLIFKNLCGYIVVKLYGDQIIKSITLTGNNEEKIAGQAKVTAIYGESPTVDLLEDYTFIELTCKSLYSDGIELGKTADEATEFWFVVPPITFTNGFTLTITDTEGYVYTKTTHTKRTVSRNIKNSLQPFDVMSTVPEGNVLFEDDNFKAYCVEKFDNNGDGEISFLEASSIESVSCSNRSISSLKGIECFTRLVYLYCDGNQLTTLDVSKNPALYTLYCDENQLTSLIVNNPGLHELDCPRNQLTTLDVSKTPALYRLECAENKLTTLDLSSNIGLQMLLCDGNQLTTLDLSSNIRLQMLLCDCNQLTSLDITKNTALEQLYCVSNQLTTMDVSNKTKLEFLYCQDNLLTSLNVSNDQKLHTLLCSSNQLTAIDVSTNKALSTFWCDGNQLTSLDVSTNTRLWQLWCNDNLLTSLDVSNNSRLDDLRCNNNPYLTEIWLKSGQTINIINYDWGVATIKYRGVDDVVIQPPI